MVCVFMQPVRILGAMNFNEVEYYYYYYYQPIMTGHHRSLKKFKTLKIPSYSKLRLNSIGQRKYLLKINDQ